MSSGGAQARPATVQLHAQTATVQLSSVRCRYTATIGAEFTGPDDLQLAASTCFIDRGPRAIPAPAAG
jgi:hypothetical protein